MAAVLESYTGLEEDIARAQQLANARKKLKSFRATRSSDHDTASFSSSTSRSSSNAPFPLTTDTTFNVSTLTNSPHDHDASKGFDLPPLPEQARSPGQMRTRRSKGSMSHRRQNSSISGHGLMRGSVVGSFDTEQLDARPMRAEVPRLPSSDVNAAPNAPLFAAPTMNNASPPEDHAAVKSRLTAFSFGSKPPPNARSPSPRARRGQPLLPSQLHSAEAFPSPETSPIKRGSMSTPLSRPPSLLLTRPTPLAFGSPSPAGPPRQLEPPSTPPTPARSKRHSHTRSNSISMPNLKLTSRPTSLGIPNSPSFPSSPSSPSMLSRPNSIQGTRLKFEPSGRGAEAEKEKEEYRRKALEQLTGSPNPSPSLPESPGNEIALPELDDEDGSSVASSARPFSGFGSFNFGRPSSSSSTPPGMSWPNSEDSPPLERWSAGFNAKSDEPDDALGSFGFTFSGSGSGSFSFGAAPPPYPPVETSIGLGLPSTVPARPSLSRNLSVLAEVDEPEDGEYDGASDPFTASPEIASAPFSPTTDELDDTSRGRHVSIVAPVPSRLRELHLASSASSGADRPIQFDSPLRNNSPTKAYGAIGRGRPAPINVHNSFDSPSVAGVTTTPKSAGGSRRRPTSGSRGSSISYKKDCESSSSSRDWSMSSSKAPFSPPTSLADVASPPAQPAFAPSFGGWGTMSRPGPARPCPRPKSLAGLAHDNQGAGRVLGELEEVDEDGLSLRNPSTRVASDDMPNSAGLSDILHESFGASGGDYEWQSAHLELEMERDALQEDVDLWRKRCNGLEERLELEKKENGILRERVRKLGDRLSSIVSYPATRSDTSLVADLRTQLFGVKAELERERNEKHSAYERIADLEAKLAAKTVSPVSTPAPIVTNIIPPTPMSPDPEDLERDAPDRSDARGVDRSPSPDPSTQRMRAWGFPRESAKANQPRNRESFFGLSQVLRPGSIYEGSEDAVGGIDLPPIDFMTAAADAQAMRSVSDPTPVPSRAFDSEDQKPTRISSDSAQAQRSTSITTSASSALSFFTGYLPSRTKSPPLAARAGSFGGFRMDQHVVQRLPSSADKGDVDFRGGCRCCTGDVIEL